MRACSVISPQNFCRIGDVLTKQGKLNEAPGGVSNCHAIRKSLVERDSPNSIWQNSIDKLYQDWGFPRGQGKHDEALTAYKDSLRVKRILIEQHPSVAS